MPIPKRPEAKPAADVFIEQAPDAKPAARWQRGSKTQITFSVDPDLLERIDAAARRRHINRAALLSLWATEKLAQEPEA